MMIRGVLRNVVRRRSRYNSMIQGLSSREWTQVREESTTRKKNGRPNKNRRNKKNRNTPSLMDQFSWNESFGDERARGIEDTTKIKQEKRI